VFRPFSSAAKGGWVNAAAGNAFKELADGYKGLSEEDIQRAAHASAQDKLVEPALRYGAHPSTHAFFSGDSLYVGVPTDHPDAGDVADQEWGTLTQPAGGHIRRALRLHGEESFSDFQDRLSE
jgi:hypothetical protein